LLNSTFIKTLSALSFVFYAFDFYVRHLVPAAPPLNLPLSSLLWLVKPFKSFANADADALLILCSVKPIVSEPEVQKRFPPTDHKTTRALHKSVKVNSRMIPGSSASESGCHSVCLSPFFALSFFFLWLNTLLE